MPSVSWATTVSPYIQLGYKVIFCDCEKTSLGLDPKHLEIICRKYNPGLVVLVNVLGHSNNLKKIISLKKKHRFEIVEDNCESLGSHKKKIRDLWTGIITFVLFSNSIIVVSSNATLFDVTEFS